ncbi:hypothetical protein C8039_04920 [Halogeometricum sp. wsp3]|nr:hypothetical protein C8039_04920 [Halogeometricum sp. wsp3]
MGPYSGKLVADTVRGETPELISPFAVSAHRLAAVRSRLEVLTVATSRCRGNRGYANEHCQEGRTQRIHDRSRDADPFEEHNTGPRSASAAANEKFAQTRTSSVSRYVFTPRTTVAA